MSTSQRSEHAYRGLNDIAQRKHLTGFADTGLKQSHPRILIEQPY